MAECASAQTRIDEQNIKGNPDIPALLKHLEKSFDLQLQEDYYFDNSHHSAVLRRDDVCVILDFNLCEIENEQAPVFDYSKYCEMQNALMSASEKLFRFYVPPGEGDADTPDTLEREIHRWLSWDAEHLEVSDNGGSFDKGHIDNTPLEKKFEDLFIDAYGHDSLNYLQKEYSVSLRNGRNAFIDYVIETDHGDFAVEENGVRYHHPQIIRMQAYLRQLEKQNTLSLLGFKTYRFSFENLKFREQAIDSIQTFFGPKQSFRSPSLIKGTRPFALYTHQEGFLQEMKEARKNGVTTSLIVSPTGSGKSQIAIEDIGELYREGKIQRVLVMVPSTRIRDDWEKRLRAYRDKIDITIDLYNRSYMRRSDTPSDYYDYLLFDEAQHARAANCAKTLQFFTPKYLVGLTATPDRLDGKKLEKLMTAAGFAAKAVYGGNPHNEEIFAKYASGEIQFLISCQLISEGWDSPQTEVVVMARPTLSKVLYTQQIGRGVRKYPGKECLYVIDVVDNYEGKLSPMNFNALFRLSRYSDFMGVKNNSHDYLSILGLNETEISMQEIDIHTFEEKYKDYRSPEQAARELFIGTATLMSWYRKDNTISSLTLPIGSRQVPYFSKEDIEAIRAGHNLGIHDDSTILKDFEDFIDENTLTFSFKLIFMLNMLKLADKEGEVNIDDLLQEYRAFYMDRIEHDLPVDRANCAYNREFLDDPVKMKRSLLTNPFEKFERKRFVYYSKDLNILSFHPALWQQLTEEKREEIRGKEMQFLKQYYEKLGGLVES